MVLCVFCVPRLSSFFTCRHSFAHTCNELEHCEHCDRSIANKLRSCCFHLHSHSLLPIYGIHLRLQFVLLLLKLFLCSVIVSRLVVALDIWFTHADARSATQLDMWFDNLVIHYVVIIIIYYGQMHKLSASKLILSSAATVKNYYFWSLQESN